MTSPIAIAVAAQLTLAAASKSLSRERGRLTDQVATAGRLQTYVAADLLFAALVAVPSTTRIGGACVSIMISIGLILDWGRRGNAGDCKCFGYSRVARRPWRRVVSKCIIWAEAVLLLLFGSSKLVGDPADYLLAAVLLISIGMLSPELVPAVYREDAELPPSDVVRMMGRSPEMARWRWALTNDAPFRVVRNGNTFEVGLDAWIGCPAILIARVRNGSITITPYDAQTLEAMAPAFVAAQFSASTPA